LCFKQRSVPSKANIERRSHKRNKEENSSTYT
jgi:hypothetical protein